MEIEHRNRENSLLVVNKKIYKLNYLFFRKE